MHSITIAIITFRRPALLQKTLTALAEITFPDDTTVNILVIDNDSEHSAFSMIHSPVRYIAEPRQGRGYARNAALKACDSDYLVFIDDDILVDKDWLYQLYRAASVFNAQMVAGHITYHLPEDAPKWAKACRLFMPRNMATGGMLRSANTGNLLIDRRWVEKEALQFPLQPYGEDTVFTADAFRHGAKIIHCGEAKAQTWVPTDRLTLRSIWRRTLQNGAIRSHLRSQGRPTGTARLILLVGMLKLAMLACGALAAAVMGKRHWIRFVEHAGTSLGWMIGICGHKGLECPRPSHHKV